MIKITIRNIDQWIDFLKKIPNGVKGKAMRAFTEYIVGDGTHGLKHYPAYKHVTRKAAYGKTFVSDRQRRYVMARIREGTITPGYPRRTGNQQRGWTINGEGTRLWVSNNARGIGYTMGDTTQARQPAMVGWRKAKDVVKSNIRGALRSAQAAVSAWIKSNKP